MATSKINAEFNRALQNDGKVDDTEAKRIIDAAKDWFFVTSSEKRAINDLLDNHTDKFSLSAANRLRKFVGRPMVTAPAPTTPGGTTTAPTTPATPTTPTTPGATPTTPPRINEVTLRANHNVWTTTYWPMAGSLDDANGNASSNLWAKDGALDKFDKLLKARNQTTGALAFERKPALNSMIGEEKGHYIPSGTLNEADAERTTGVDFNRNGKIDANIKNDFLNEHGQFGSDGKTDGTMGVGWWGSCDKVALAGILFKDPKKDVTLNGVTFTAQDIRGLLTVIADSQAHGVDFQGSRYDGRPDVVYLSNGDTVVGVIQDMTSADFRSGDYYRREGDFVVRQGVDSDIKVKKPDGSEVTIPKAKVKAVAREDKQDIFPAKFHETTKSWLADRRPFAMDHDSGDHVWNDNYDGAKIRELPAPPAGLDLATLNGENGKTTGGTLKFFETDLLKGDSVSKNYSYWLEEKNGKVINSGWTGYSNPDFMWRPSSEPTFTGHNARNPFVTPELVKEIYLKSIE